MSGQVVDLDICWLLAVIFLFLFVVYEVLRVKMLVLIPLEIVRLSVVLFWSFGLD